VQRNGGSIEPPFRLHPLVEQARPGPGTPLMRFVFDPGRREPPATPVGLTGKCQTTRDSAYPRLLPALKSSCHGNRSRPAEVDFQVPGKIPPLPVHRHVNPAVSDRYHMRL